MARKKNMFDGVEVEEAPVVAIPDDFMDALEPDRPKRYEPGWTDYLLGKLVRGEYVEKDGKKHPLVHGLRRLVLAEMGYIIESRPTETQFPSPANGNVAGSVYMVRIADRESNADVTFADAADVTPDNCDEPFDAYATSTATTRAEARALRKALTLKVVAFEELSERANGPRTARTPVGASVVRDPSAPGTILPQQITSIQKNCRDMGIKIEDFLAKSERPVSSLNEVSEQTAEKMGRILNGWFQNRSKIPADLLRQTGVSQGVGQ